MSQDHVVDQVTVKEQGLLAVLGLTVITLGIYGLFWYYRITREMRDIGAARGDAELAAVNPTMSTIALFVPVANLIAIHRTGRRIQRTQTLTGATADYSMAVHWILVLFTGLWSLYSQHALNGAWMRAAGAGPAMSTAQVAAPVGASQGGPFVSR